MLTDTKLRNLKPQDKLYKVNDRDGLYVAVTPAGAISFRYNYSINGRQETITFGRYGVGGITLAEAREQLATFLEAGGTLVDTADMYADGASEELVGRLLAETGILFVGHAERPAFADTPFEWVQEPSVFACRRPKIIQPQALALQASAALKELPAAAPLPVPTFERRKQPPQTHLSTQPSSGARLTTSIRAVSVSSCRRKPTR